VSGSLGQDIQDSWDKDLQGTLATAFDGDNRHKAAIFEADVAQYFDDWYNNSGNKQTTNQLRTQ